MTIGNNIKRIREEKGMTQKELADKCNIIYQTIGKYERNLLNPKYETLEKIAKALEVSSFDLIDGYKVPVYQVKHINIELEPWALYYSNIFNTYKEKSDLFYTWYRRKKQEVSYELLKLVHTPFIDEREQEESYFNSLSDEEVEKEFNKLVDKLKLENNKLLEELNKLENK